MLRVHLMLYGSLVLQTRSGAHDVVVSHPPRMRKTLGSNPSVSIWAECCSGFLRHGPLPTAPPPRPCTPSLLAAWQAQPRPQQACGCQADAAVTGPPAFPQLSPSAFPQMSSSKRACIVTHTWTESSCYAYILCSTQVLCCKHVMGHMV